MSTRSLEDLLGSVDSPVEMLRSQGRGAFGFPNVPDEHTTWIEEQRAWRETCSFADQSHHMVDFWVEGPDALELFSDLAVNGFEGYEPGTAKQLVLANPEGYFIGDGILFYFDEDDFALVGPPQAANWVQFHAETGDYDVATERDETSGVRDGPPTNYRYQIQGPKALDVMQSVADEPLPDLGFFNFTDITIDGREVTLLRHGMSGEAGFEFWGPWEDGEAIKRLVLEAGEEHGIRQLGGMSYGSSAVVSGWLGMPLPAVYDSESMRDYREWLDARSVEGYYSIAGSLDADDVTDYYVTPVEIGYGRLVDLDHDFVGREAIAAELDDPDRTLVTLEWDDDDVIDVFGSLFRDGETKRFLQLPIPWRSTSHHDRIEKDGELVGTSRMGAYTYNERTMLSLAVLNVDLAEPGTEVTVVWGEPDGSANPAVERHESTEIRATVAPVPYTADNR
ncbi:aminomethyl transferase family protein [Halobellus rubicundus]|uniref:Aminomethyl transferase family protein n=1 Tax=Halobellus rubicundus TaxID=2996466 RepID=A0ABD5MCJ0_9EURY